MMTAWDTALANFLAATAECDALPNTDPGIDAAFDRWTTAMDVLFDAQAPDAEGLQLKVLLAKERFAGFSFPDDLLDALIADARRFPA